MEGYSLEGISPKQWAILAVIQEHLKTKGYPPTIKRNRQKIGATIYGYNIFASQAVGRLRLHSKRS